MKIKLASTQPVILPDHVLSLSGYTNIAKDALSARLLTELSSAKTTAEVANVERVLSALPCETNEMWRGMLAEAKAKAVQLQSVVDTSELLEAIRKFEEGGPAYVSEWQTAARAEGEEVERALISSMETLLQRGFTGIEQGAEDVMALVRLGREVNEVRGWGSPSESARICSCFRACQQLLRGFW